MRFFLYRTSRKPFHFSPLLLVCHILVFSCGEKAVDPQESLNTTPHEHIGVYWENFSIQADISWRFISAEETFGDRIAITGAWTITFRNTGVNDYLIHVRRFTFEDASNFQIVEYTPITPGTYIDSFIIDESQVARRTGNFEIYVDSVDTANTITKMGIYISGILLP